MARRPTATDENLQWVNFLKDLTESLLLDYTNVRTKDSLRTKHKELIDLTATNDYRGYARIKECLPTFLADVNEIFNEQYDRMFKNLNLNSLKVRLLSDLLRSTLSEANFETVNKKLMVKGWAIRTTSINKYLKENPNVVKGLKAVEIFALEKVFIDEHMDFSKLGIQLTIIAPQWEVVPWNYGEGRVTVNVVLDGEDGASYEKDAGNLDVPGSDGNDGKQGLPGGSAGSMLGIGLSCDSCESLKISAIGGRGGPGQDGGDGQKGKDGREASQPVKDKSHEDCNAMKEEWKSEGCTPSCKPVVGKSKWTHFYTLGYDQLCDIDGGGKPGGNGGNGGPGGIGGNGGRVSLFVQSDPEIGSLTISNARGKPGNPGKGGKGGAGALRKIWKVELTSTTEAMDYICGIEYDNGRVTEEFPKSKDGKIGLVQDTNKQDGQWSYSMNPSLTINDYKNYLRENMKNNELMAPVLRKFLEYLEQDEKITGLYDTLGLIKDLLGLESQSGQAMQSLVRKQSYQSLLKRVEKYELQQHEKKDADDFKLVLSYLYTAISSRINDIDNEANKDLVVDVRKNLAYMEENIEEWRNFKDLVGKNKVRNKFKDGIQRKIEEANAFIENEITKDIESNIEKTTGQLNKLYAETVKLQTAAEEEKKKLIERKEQLERQLVLRSILGVVQIASQALAFIGPVGAAAGAVIGGVTSIVEGVATSDNPSADVAVSALPGAVSTTLKKLNDAYKEKQEKFKKQLLKANTKMEDFLKDKDVKADASAAKKKVLQIQSDIAVTKSKLDELVKRSSIEDPASVSEMYDLRKKMDSLLKEGKEEIGKLGGADKYKNVLEKVQNIVGLAKMGVDLYSKVQGDLDKIDGVDKSISAVNAKMVKLDAYEESIYTKMGPMIGRIKKSLESAENSEGKSHAALDITKWQVQGSIRDVRKELQEMTKGFEAGNDLTYYIDKVEYAMSMMIQMFDRIQSYSEQGDLVDVITDVDSAADILNADLYTAVSELKLKISSNILADYKNTMDAVKQYVFPFAVEYLKPLTLPERFNLNKTDQLVYNLRTLQKTLQREESTTLTRESDIMADVLFTDGAMLPPFYVWNDKKQIEGLLTGYPKGFKADIEKSTIKETAVKFNDIGIKFKAKDENTQRRLDEALAAYTVKMKHHGESYYRCKGNIYQVRHQPQTIVHGAVKNVIGGYSNGNVIHSKITHNDPVLSPFAWWFIQLQSKDGKFDSLAEFVGADIELVLEGKGSFVKSDRVSCSSELSNYYKFLRTTSAQRRSGLGVFEEIFEKLEGYTELEESENVKGDAVANESRNQTERMSGQDANPSPVEFLKYQTPYGQNQQIAADLHDGPSNGVSGPVNLLSVPGNLPLYELMIRKLNGTKRTRRNMFSERQDVGSEYAHDLAYSAYAPK